jgi:hypothetical protein
VLSRSRKSPEGPNFNQPDPSFKKGIKSLPTRNKKNKAPTKLGERPHIVLIGTIASIIAILVFVTGKAKLQDLWNDPNSTPPAVYVGIKAFDVNKDYDYELSKELVSIFRNKGYEAKVIEFPSPSPDLSNVVSATVSLDWNEVGVMSKKIPVYYKVKLDLVFYDSSGKQACAERIFSDQPSENDILAGIPSVLSGDFSVLKKVVIEKGVANILLQLRNEDMMPLCSEQGGKK